MHLLLARHGETDWNVERRIQGWGNSSLTAFGVDQIKLLGERLSAVHLTAIYSSDAVRAVQTAQAVIGDRTVPLTLMQELRETSWGRWEGKTAAEISEEEPELWRRFTTRDHEDPSSDQADWEATTIVPGGEPIGHVSSRMNGAVKKIVELHSAADDYVLIVGHGGSLRFIIAELIGLRPSASRRFHLDNASLTHFTIDRQRTVMKLLNDSSHWSGSLAP